MRLVGTPFTSHAAKAAHPLQLRTKKRVLFAERKWAMGHWKLFALTVCALLPGFALKPQQVLDVVYPIDSGSISCNSVDLGVVAPDASYRAKIELRNHTYRTIYLSPPMTDCGCMVVDKAPLTLPPHSSKSIGVQIQVPSKPGTMSRMVVVRRRGDPRTSWFGNITASVEARLWAEPGEVLVRHEGRESAEATVVIRHLPHERIRDIVPSTEGVTVAECLPLADGQMVKVQVSAAVESASLEVYAKDETESPSLEIPIRCFATPVVSFVPPQIDLNSLERVAEGLLIEATVAALLSTDGNPDEVRFETIAPWARLQCAERVAESTWKLRLTFDAELMPHSLSETVVRATMSGTPREARLKAHRDSG